MPNRILVSACLLGSNVRYSGGNALCSSKILSDWQKEGLLIPIYPEMAAGLLMPRPSSEIVGKGGGAAVLEGKAQVVTHTGIDRTHMFEDAAKQALELTKKHQIRMAILKANSPSCGSQHIYDGSFSGNKIAGQGVTTALLIQNGIAVFDETQLADALTFWERL